MADDDKKFEGALAGFLHRERRDSEGHVFCPEPELLAAYHERALSPEEIQVARLHVEGCSRCQEVLAQLKKTEELPLAAAPVHKSESAHVPPLTFPGSATPATNRSLWRWIAPAGAVAAGLLLWLAYQQNHSTKISSSDSLQVTENRKEVDAPAPLPQPPVGQSDSGLREQAREVEIKPLKKTEPPTSPQISGNEVKTSSTENPGVVGRTGQLSAYDTPSSGAEESATGSALSAEKSQVPSVASAPVLAANVGSAVKAQAFDKAGASAKKQMPMHFKAAKNPVIIGTAGTAVWRVGPAGSVEISVDGGNNWHAQISGVSADLSAGSAPLAGVCWVVGRTGTILLTTDSGATWRKVNSPIEKDIAGVLALDASSARVWDASNEKFETTDGGLTWNRVASK